MHELADAQLLRAYAQQGDQAAFRELVTRYSDLVYSAALRQVNSPDPARDIAQSVFTDLALKARTLADKLPTDGSLVGWLHRSTRFAVLNLLRDVRRRRENERQAMEQLRTNSAPEPEWDGIRPVLDEALDSLDDEDRDALLLRFFKNHDFRTIGAALGVSDDTAQKRVSRALDRLRAEFNRRGVTTSAVALTAALSANAVAASPAGLAATLSSAALTSSPLAATVTATATQATMNWLNIKSISAIVAAAIAAGTGTHLVQRHETNLLRNEKQNLIAQQQQLTNERDAALSTATANKNELERLHKEKSELLRLRGEVGVLRRESIELDRLRNDNAQLLRQVQVNQSTAQGTNSPPVVAKIVVTHIKQPQLVSEEQIRTNITVKVGDIFDRAAVDRDVRNLQGSGFFANIRVTSQTTDEGVVVNYLVQEKPKLTGIRFSGNTKLDEAVLGKPLLSKVGEPMDEGMLFNDAQRIQELYVISGISGAKVKSASKVNEDIGEAEVTFTITE